LQPHCGASGTHGNGASPSEKRACTRSDGSSDQRTAGNDHCHLSDNCHRGARTGKNPQTGEPVKIKASNTVAFKPGNSLKDSVNP
jgi:hypothetical protein